MKRLLVPIFVVAIVSVVGFVAATAPAAGPAAVVIAPGVEVAGVRLGGLTSEPARARVRAVFEQPLELSFEGRRFRASARALGATAAVDDAVSAALRARRGEKVRLAVGVRRKSVDAYVRRLAKRHRVPAKNAQLVGFPDLRPQISAEQAGIAVDVPATRARIMRALRSTKRTPIRVAVKAIEPDVTRASFGAIVVIRRESKQLHLYAGEQLVQTFGVATGTSEYPTPVGLFNVVDMQRDPWWRPPDSDWARGKEPIPPGPGNPLGTRWMGISSPGVGIHGTPDAASIGYSASHGCIRMRIPDAEWLFENVTWGTPVYIAAA